MLLLGRVTPVTPERRFREVRHVRNGAFGTSSVVIGIGLAAGALLAEPDLPRFLLGLAAAVTLVAGRLARVETTVTDAAVAVRVPPLRSRVIPLTDITEAQIVIADSLVPLFGGWNSRAGLTASRVRDLKVIGASATRPSDSTLSMAGSSRSGPGGRRSWRRPWRSGEPRQTCPWSWPLPHHRAAGTRPETNHDAR